jgi:hypothetical protein
MMEKFEGKCVGGPHDGMMLAHWSKSKEFFSPMTPYLSQAIIPVKIGEYRLNDFEQWHWFETEEGKAMERLAGRRWK